MVRRIVKLLSALVILVVVSVAGLVGLIEAGAFDAPLNARARTALEKAIGRNVTASVGSTVLRITSAGALALEARDVSVTEPDSATNMLETDSVSLSLDPLALFSGKDRNFPYRGQRAFAVTRCLAARPADRSDEGADICHTGRP